MIDKDKIFNTDISKYIYFETGNGILLNGDCLEIMPLINDGFIDLVLTDVPYKQEFHGGGMSKNIPNYLKISEYGANKKNDYNFILNLLFKKLSQINFFSFCDKETKYDLITYAKNKNFGYKELCFCKTAPTPFTNNQWLPDVEFGLHIFKNLKVMGDYTTKKSFSVMSNFKEPLINHPSSKKTTEIERILSNISIKENLVLDCFSGSGTTAIACENLNRKWICIEKEIDYCKITKKRIEQLPKYQFLREMF